MFQSEPAGARSPYTLRKQIFLYTERSVAGMAERIKNAMGKYSHIEISLLMMSVIQ